MRKIYISFLCCAFIFTNARAQFSDSFTDGNFTANPAWTGGTADWIVNPAFQLQSNNTTANSTFYLSTPNTLATTAQWDFYCNITFNPSGTNYIDVFLTASAADLTLNATTGYFVRIGNTADEIALYRKDASGAVTKIIDGADAVLNTSNNAMRIRVIRNAANLWTLNRDLTGTGSSYVTEGTVTDNTFGTSAFFGILVKQSTAGFFQRHFFDDISVQAFVPDVTPPAVVSATAVSAAAVDILFSEAVDIITAQNTANYSVSNGAGTPVSAVRDAVNTSLVHLSFAGNLQPRVNLTLTANGVKDLAGNTLTNGAAVFIYFTPIQYDVVIDEIMADPTPVVQLPTNEWLELKNTSTFPINLQNWRLGKSTGESGPFPSYTIPAGGYVIVCTASAVAAMAPYGPVISVTNFPSLNNDADQIYLATPTGLVIHSVSYNDQWYKNDLKRLGGWTLEMIDPGNPCSGIDNWKASNDIRGGTPGTINSVNAINIDTQSPRLLRAYALDPTHISLQFSEPVNNTSASLPANFNIDGGGGPIIAAFAQQIAYDVVKLTLGSPLLPNKIYNITANNITDCSGNAIGTKKTVRVGLAQAIDSFDIVINEILFNPKSNGYDFVELFNRSNKIINTSSLRLANRAVSGNVDNILFFPNEGSAFFPGDYLLITQSAEALKRDFLVLNPDAVMATSIALPGYSESAGDVIILNEQGKIVDEVKYSEKWHFPLISNREGVSLERINPDAPSVQSNFHSAASSVGYGTPTYKNSQYRMDADVQGSISVSPEIMSPDNDGMDDFATIQYSFPDVGYVANITIFDASGRPVRYLQRNALNGLKGYYRWDGLGEKQQKLPVGMYIIYTEVFNLQGKTKKFKNTIVLARRQ